MKSKAHGGFNNKRKEKMMKLWITLISMLLVHVVVLGQDKFFEMDGHHILLGSVKSFEIPVRSINGDSTYMPITVINGKKEGPVLGLMAGIHGYEYPPIIALQQLVNTIDPASLSGTLVIVHIANVPAFFGRSVYYNPIDHKNLNRSFPGNQNGTLTDCMAYAISNKILPKVDYFIDIHGGDASEDLHPYVGYTVSGTQTEAGKAMAEAMEFDWIMRAESKKEVNAPSLYCSQEAIARDIPTIAIECGKLGVVTPEEVEKINLGLYNVMRLLKMLSGEVKNSNKAIEFTKRKSIYSESNGIFYSLHSSGQLIKKDQKIGYITDLYGNHLQDVISPISGVIIYMIGTPPINKGELLFNLGELPIEFDSSNM